MVTTSAMYTQETTARKLRRKTNSTEEGTHNYAPHFSVVRERDRPDITEYTDSPQP